MYVLRFVQLTFFQIITRENILITMKFDLWVGCELVPKAGHSFNRGPLDQGEGAGAPTDFTHLFSAAVEQHKLDHLDPQTKKSGQP